MWLTRLDAGLVAEEVSSDKVKVLPAEQVSVELNATQIIYQLTCGPVDVTATFTSPLLIQNLDMLARSVSISLWRQNLTKGFA